MPHGFSPHALDLDGNLFEELAASARFEDAGKGRVGAVLTRPDATGGTPLVRTTARSATPAQPFRPVHDRLARAIAACAGLPGGFNNALIERYTNACTTMAAHSDQALDLAEESYIAVFSCYRRPGPARRLLVEPKEPGGDAFELPLTHHGAVVFSTATNRRFRHRIVLDAAGRTVDNEWLGVTFRTSKTLVRYRDGLAYLPGGERLTLAGDEQQREFFRLRRRENTEVGFAYPALTYTVSEGDLRPATVAPVSRSPG